MVRVGRLADKSCPTDLCPSFEMHRRGEAIVLWVDHPDPRRRELGPAPRFLIHRLEKDSETGWWVSPENPPSLLEGESVEDVTAFLERFEREGFGRSCSSGL
jgi:hypothetical protein